MAIPTVYFQQKIAGTGGPAGFSPSLRWNCIVVMTQLTSGATAPDLSATSGVTIQGSTVNPDGTFSPAAAYTIESSGSQLTCYVPALCAVLIQIA
jgi:hypothetical protein